MHPEDRRPTGSEYADSVRAVLDRAAEVEGSTGMQVAVRRPVLTRPPVVAGLVIVFAAVVVWNLRALSPTAPPLPPAEEEASLAVSALVVGQMIEAFRAEHGRLPASLEELGVPTQGLEFVVDGDRYELRLEGASTAVTVDDEQSPDALLRALEIPPPPGGGDR